MTTSYFVGDENTLCHQVEGSSRLGVLASSVIRGGRNPLDGCTHPSTFRTLRPATAADFADYRVMVTKYIAARLARM